MPKIDVEHLNPASDRAAGLITELNDLAEQIRRRAFELFEGRGGGHGSDLEDWLRAESEIQSTGAVDVSHEEGAHRFRLSVPGFDRKDLQVHVLNNELIVTGQSEHVDSASSKTVRKILYRLALPERARTDQITVEAKGSAVEITVPTPEETTSDRIDKSADDVRVQKKGAA